MRQYRGISKETGEWVYGYYSKRCYAIGSTGPDMVIDVIITIDGLIPEEIDPETCGQSTGLKDKNGKEIYEGDICLAALPEERFPIEVIWDKAVAGFLFQWQDNTYESGKDEMMIDLFTDIEIIGNIYENPKLKRVK